MTTRAPSVCDLLDEHGRFKRPDELPRRVLKELERFTVDRDGRINGFRFRERNRHPKFRLSKKRKRTRITKVMEHQLEQRLEEHIAGLRTARQHGA